MNTPIGYIADNDTYYCFDCHENRYGEDDQGHEHILISHAFDCDDCGGCIR